MRRRVFCAAALLGAALCAQAQQKPQADAGLKLRMSEIELGATHERLSGGRPGWRSLYLEGQHRLGERHAVYGGIRETERFNLGDTEVWAGYTRPFGPDWTALVEASASGSHRVLPKYSLFGQVSRRLAAGWSLNLGLRHSEYNLSGVNLLVMGGERYFGNWRAAYTLYNGRPEGASSGSAHRFALSYYYGERSSVGLAFTTGREVENVGPPLGITSTDVRNLTLAGRHWFTPAWALTWELLTQEQGTLYRRDGFRLGLRHQF
jgi:YaiO family outer membrane protein